MKRESIQSHSRLRILIASAIVIFLLAFPVMAQVGKKGETRTETTTAPKKTAPKKSTTSPKANRTSGAKQPARKAGPAANAPNPAVEVAFWETIKTSKNPEDFREYLKKYPNGEFAGLARNRINALESAAKEETKQREESEKKRAGTIVRNQIGMEFVYVPAGSFMMGSENGYINEKPAHQVVIHNGFYIGRYEVTQAQWQAVMGSNPSKFKGCDQCPVEMISWHDAQEFIRKLNARGDGFTYRLPNEAEWEYACRAGTSGDNIGNVEAMAWTYENSGDKRLSGEYSFTEMASNNNRTHPVGQKQPNAWGLYDMLGNVWEFCEDIYHSTYIGAPTDGSTWLSGDANVRVMRGFSWYNQNVNLNAADRNSIGTTSITDAIGFRVVSARSQ